MDEMLYYNKFKFLVLLCLAALAAMPSKRVEAHPHAYIDLGSGVVFDEDNNISALKVFWRFDKLYTAFVLSGYSPDENGKFDQDYLRAMAQENLSNLKEYDYFTRIRKDGKTISATLGDEYQTDVENGQLWMSFILQLEKPVSAVAFDYAVYDPTFYVEILHEEPIIDFGDSSFAEEHCSYDITKPSPNEELLSMLASLGREETAGTGVGQFFAETVSITCD